MPVTRIVRCGLQEMFPPEPQRYPSLRRERVLHALPATSEDLLCVLKGGGASTADRAAHAGVRRRTRSGVVEELELQAAPTSCPATPARVTACRPAPGPSTNFRRTGRVQ